MLPMTGCAFVSLASLYHFRNNITNLIHTTRYHVGESMLASIRHFMRFIELDKKFDSHGFRIKVRLAWP